MLISRRPGLHSSPHFNVHDRQVGDARLPADVLRCLTLLLALLVLLLVGIRTIVAGAGDVALRVLRTVVYALAALAGAIDIAVRPRGAIALTPTAGALQITGRACHAGELATAGSAIHGALAVFLAFDVASATFAVLVATFACLTLVTASSLRTILRRSVVALPIVGGVAALGGRVGITLRGGGVRGFLLVCGGGFGFCFTRNRCRLGRR